MSYEHSYFHGPFNSELVHFNPLRTSIKLSKQNPGFLSATVQFYVSFEASRVPKTGGIMFCDW
jgi:hypothetical protein